jgi:hypothetical protein
MTCELTEADVIIRANCGECWAQPGKPCNRAVFTGEWVTVSGGRFHVSRVERIDRKLPGWRAAVCGERP